MQASSCPAYSRAALCWATETILRRKVRNRPPIRSWEWGYRSLQLDFNFRFSLGYNFGGMKILSLENKRVIPSNILDSAVSGFDNRNDWYALICATCSVTFTKSIQFRDELASQSRAVGPETVMLSRNVGQRSNMISCVRFCRVPRIDLAVIQRCV